METMYEITLQNGKTMIVESLDKTKNPVGLWIYCLRQATPQIINFADGHAVRADEIVSMKPIQIDEHGMIV